MMLAPRSVPRRNRLPYCREHTPGQGTLVPYVGDAMLTALRLVWEVEGCTKAHVVAQLARRESRAYGYRVVARLIEASLIEARRDGRNYRLTTTQLGRGVLGQTPVAA